MLIYTSNEKDLVDLDLDKMAKEVATLVWKNRKQHVGRRDIFLKSFDPILRFVYFQMLLVGFNDLFYFFK